ncbi:MAG: glutaredoxin [Trueperaceae bacterium]|nr:glutaredoxin [Trueperaceae bacterium]
MMRFVRPNRSNPWLLLFTLLATLVSPGALAQGDPFPVPVYFFWGDGCPHCAAQKVFHEQLLADHPNVVIHAYEVYNVPENRPLMAAMAEAFGRPVTGVPMTFIGDEVWVGYTDAYGRQMTDAVARYGTYAAPDPVDRVAPELREQFVPTPAPAAPPPPSGPSGGTTIDVPLFGAIDVGSRALWLSTALIAFVDGFNPCSLWVLALLLAVVINSKSRRRVLLVGLTFLVVTATVYGLFIAGLFSIFSYVSFLGWIRVLVAVIALAFALINLKDYVAYKQGISLTIDDAQKPGIYKRIRGIMNARASLPATLAATGGMALGVTLVELPCTAGLPVLWTTILADAGAGAGAFVLLLVLYMVIYLLDELVVFGAVVVTMRAARIEEREGRVLKLVGGAVMLALALVMLFRPTLLESIGGTVAVFGVAIGASLVVLLLHRILHPASCPWAPTKAPAEVAGKAG